MHIRFSEIDTSFIKEAIEQGFYLSETELVRDAVRRMRETMQLQNNNRFKQAVEAGIKSLKNDDAIEFTPELMQKIKKNAIETVKNGGTYIKNDSVPN